MRRRLYAYVPGIMTFPGASDNWSGRAVTYTHLHASPGAVAEKVEYFCGPIGRAFGQKDRVEKLARVLAFYAGWEIVLVGHSNGCAVIVEALKANDWIAAVAVHLVSGACEADFTRNGLNYALASKRIGQVNCYVGGEDMALRAAHTWAGAALGYGTLGLHGPLGVSDLVSDRVHCETWPDFGHSTAFQDNYFEGTMARFLG